MNIPKGSQIMALCVQNGTLDAGFFDPDYCDVHNGANHWGWDIKCNHTFNIVASGNGRVVACGRDFGTLRFVTVIVYDHVYLPQYGVVRPIVQRLYHQAALYVKKGQYVTRGQVIGTVVGIYDDPNTGTATKPIYKFLECHHVHVEFDSDAQYPQYSPQVKGGLYIKRSPKNGWKSVIDPANVFVIGNGQSLVGNSVDTFYKASDLLLAHE